MISQFASDVLIRLILVPANWDKPANPKLDHTNFHVVHLKSSMPGSP
jgi:hypothetical protein